MGQVSMSGWAFAVSAYSAQDYNQGHFSYPYVSAPVPVNSSNGNITFLRRAHENTSIGYVPLSIPANHHATSLAIVVPQWSGASYEGQALNYMYVAYVLYDVDDPSNHVVLYTGHHWDRWSGNSNADGVLNNGMFDISKKMVLAWPNDGTYYNAASTTLYLNDHNIWDHFPTTLNFCLRVYTTQPKQKYQTRIGQYQGSASNVAILYYEENNDPPNQPTILWPNGQNKITHNTTPYFKAVSTDPDLHRISYRFETYRYNNNSPVLLESATTSTTESGTAREWHASIILQGDPQNKYIIKVTPIDSKNVEGESAQAVFTLEALADPPAATNAVIAASLLNSYHTHIREAYEWYGLDTSTLGFVDQTAGTQLLRAHLDPLKAKIEALPKVTATITLPEQGTVKATTSNTFSTFRTRLINA